MVVENFKNKKAWIRILEASMAVMIIASVLLVIYSRNNPQVDRQEQVYSIQREMLDFVSENQTLRGFVVNGNEEELSKVLSNFVPKRYDFKIFICDVDRSCGFIDINKEVFVQERLIVGNLQDYNPKKLRIFMWVR